MIPERPFLNQDYFQLKKTCISSGELFSDPEFPASDDSLFFHKHSNHSIVWKRPNEICPTAQFMVDGVAGSDVAQGMLGNCWFVAACSALTHNPSLVSKVIPDPLEQEMLPGQYCGIFHFRFWQFGQWLDVVVDDLLPCKNGKLYFAKSRTTNEFWSALLEKAFAKLCGCYEALAGGLLSGALMDLSGGVPETITMTESVDPNGIFQSLQLALDHDALMAAAIQVTSADELEECLDCGLVKGHSYAITAMRTVVNCTTSINKDATCNYLLMVRLQNPWGGVEWKGAWSDGSAQWEGVSAEEKNEMGLTFDEDGEFWMSWNDFCHYFTHVTVCHRMDISKNDNEDKPIHCHAFVGAWRKDSYLNNRAGGCLNFKESCLQNPQYLLDVREELNNTIVSVVQEDKRKQLGEKAVPLTIGLTVFQVESNRKYRLHKLPEPLSFSEYSNSMTCFLRIDSLKPGRYIILPTTYAPGEENKFFLRIYTQKRCPSKALMKHIPSSGLLKPKMKYVTKVTVIGADNFGIDNLDSFCRIEYGNDKIDSTVVKKCSSPQWNLNAIFYSNSLKSPVIVKVYDVSSGRSVLLDSVSVNTPLQNVARKDSYSVTRIPSSQIEVEVATFDDPMYL